MRLIAAVVASGLMWFLSTGVNHVWPLAWVAPVPLLAMLPDLRSGRAASAAFAAAALGALNLVVAYLRLPLTISLGAVLLLGLEFTLRSFAYAKMPSLHGMCENHPKEDQK